MGNAARSKMARHKHWSGERGLYARGTCSCGSAILVLVLLQDLKVFRLHGGYALQAGHNDTPILGLDKPFRVFHREFILHTDALETDHRQNWAASFGGLYSVCPYFAVETWITQAIHGHPPSFIAKVDFIIPFQEMNEQP